jgi:hypothetical protein
VLSIRRGQERTLTKGVPGLYFADAPTMISIGPSARFIAGMLTMSAKLARAVARQSKAAPSRARPDVIQARTGAR